MPQDCDSCYPLESMARQGITWKYDTIHKVIGQGDFVLTMSEGQFGGKHVAFYDLFRVENRKIVEHWDVIQDIPCKGKLEESERQILIHSF